MCPENNKQVNTYEAHNATVVFLQGIGEICWGFWCWERFVDAAAFDTFLLFFPLLLDWVVLFCVQLFGFETEVVVRMFLCFNVKELQNLLPWRAVRETGGKKQESIKLVRVLKNELLISPNPPTSSLRRLQPCKLCVYCERTPPACDLGFDMVSRRSEFFWGASWGFSWRCSVVQVSWSSFRSLIWFTLKLTTCSDFCSSLLGLLSFKMILTSYRSILLLNSLSTSGEKTR